MIPIFIFFLQKRSLLFVARVPRQVNLLDQGCYGKKGQDVGTILGKIKAYFTVLPRPERLRPSPRELFVLSVRHAGYQVGVAFEIFVTRSRVKYDRGFARLNPPGLSEFFEANPTSRSLRSDEQTLGSTDGSGRRNHLLVTHREGDSLGVANGVQDEKITNRFWNSEAGRLGRRVEALLREAFVTEKSSDDRITTRSLNRYHSRPVRRDPAYSFHFRKRLPHPDQAG